MIHFSLTSLMMAVGYSKLIHNVTTRCPTSVERRLQNSNRSRRYCSSVNVYHCIRDERDNLVETCNEPVHIPQGNYPIFLHRSDKINYKRCPNHLYQPFPVWSNEISDCEYKKSSCNGIGQIQCGNGNTTADSTCGCDYKKGYKINGVTKCCSPSAFKECYCQYFRCENILQELDADFKCINKCMHGYERSTQNICEQISGTAKSKPSRDVSTTFEPIPLPDNGKGNDLLPMQKNEVIFYVITFSGVGIFLFFVMSIIIYASIRSIWRPYRSKICICAVFICSNCLFFGLSIGYADKQEILAKTFIAIVLTLFGTTCYLVISLSLHEMITDPEVYNEDYDIRSYRLIKAAANGNLDEMKRLDDEGYIDMEVVDINGRSALHLAACEAQNVVLNYIFRHYFCFLEAKDRWNRSAEDDAEWHQKHRRDKIDVSDSKENLITNDKNYEKTLSMMNAYKHKNITKHRKELFKETKTLDLLTAARKGDMRSIKRLHELETDMNLANYSGQTAIHAAVESGMEDIVDYLIKECEVSPFVRWRGNRPLDIALGHAKDGQKTFVKKLQLYMSDLLEFQADQNDQKHDKAKLSEDYMIVRLLNAASRGDIKQMKLYKAHGYTMDLKNYDSQTALHIAVRENQEEIVEFLLQECHQINLGQTQKDRWNMTPWDVAKNSGLQNVYYKFLDNCQDLAETEDDTIKTCQLFKAAAKGELETLKSLQKQNFDMSQRDHSGRTALHLAICANNTDIVQFLVHEANVDIIPDRYNQLPIDGKTSTSITDIMQETKNDRKDQLKISAREDTLMRVIKASSMGILHKQKDIPRFKYFQMDSCDYLGNTPLHIASANGKLEDVKYLLNDRKASPFVRNNSRRSPIELVEQKVKFWVGKESDMHNKGIKEQFKEIREEIVKAMDMKNKIIEKDTLFEKLDNFERLFLFHNRIFKGDIFAIKRFLETDSALVNKLDADDRSALHIAAAAGHSHLVEFFLGLKANKNEKDRHGFTPLDEAKRNGHDQIQKLLQTL